MLLLLVFLLSALWCISIILIFMRSEENSNFWFSGLFFVMGLGKVTAILENYVIPELTEHKQVIWMISRFIGTLSLRFFPYLILMAGVSYSRVFNHQWRQKLKYWLLAPIIVTSALDFLYKEEILKVGLPQSSIYWATYIWTVPYYLFSNVLFYRAYYIETESSKKHLKLAVFIALSLPTLMTLVNNLTTAFTKDWWKYTIVQNWIVLGAFIYFICKYGLDGLRLRYQTEYENGKVFGFTFIVNNLKEPVLILDTENQVNFYNESFKADFGSFLGIDDFMKALSLKENDNPHLVAAVYDRTSTGYKCEIEFMGKVFFTNVSPLYDNDHFIGKLLLFNDVTMYKSVIKSLEKIKVKNTSVDITEVSKIIEDEYANITTKFGNITFTATEIEIIKLIAQGKSDKEIAALIYKSYGTVRNTVSNLLKRTGAVNRTKLALYVLVKQED